MLRDGKPDLAGIPDDPEEQLTPVEREAHDWVMRFAAGRATAADVQALKHWHGQSPVHSEAFAKASRLWETLGPAGQRISRREVVSIRSRALAVTPHRLGRRAFLGGAMAASAAAVGYVVTYPPLDLWPSFSEFTADYRTVTGEQKRITMADGISLDMNAQTSIAVRAAVTMADKSVADHIELIAGEAAIAAERDASRPFVVIAAQGRTIASRANFDIRYIGATVCVTCLDGEVRVEHGAAGMALQARQQLLYSSQGLSSVQTIDPTVVAAWRDGVLIFHGTPLAEAIEEVNRYRPGKIILMNDALGRRLFNARFRIENINEVVDQIRQVFDLRATSLPGGIVLLS